MANALVVYYSLDGDVRFLARALAKELSIDSMELELIKPHPAHGFMKYFKGGLLAATGATPPLRPLAHDAGHYDIIFVGTPVWNGAPPQQSGPSSRPQTSRESASPSSRATQRVT